jgi:hypothetical protein
MLKIRDRFNQLQQVKQAYLNNQKRPQPLDPRLMQYAQEWQEKHKWYKAEGDDTDSRVVRVIDDQLAAEGWNPATREYWDELSQRVKKYVSHRGNMNYNKSGGQEVGVKPKSIVTGSSNSNSPRKSESGYTLSADRVKALKDAGLWDNPEKRKAAIANYKKYDQEHGGE